MTRMPLAFSQQCRLSGLPEPTPEFRFHATRRWRFDWAFIPQKLAVEIDGGLFVQGRHSGGAGQLKDMEKLNAATLLGWRVLRVTPAQVNSGEALTLVEQALRDA